MIKKNCTLRIKPLLVYWLHSLSKKWLSANRQQYKKKKKKKHLQWPYKVQSSFFFNTLITYDS